MPPAAVRALLLWRHDRQRVAESSSGNDGRLGSGKSENGIARLCGGVDKAVGFGEQTVQGNVEVVSSLLEAIDDAFSQVAWCGQRFADNGASIRFVENDDVGERAANIN